MITETFLDSTCSLLKNFLSLKKLVERTNKFMIEPAYFQFLGEREKLDMFFLFGYYAETSKKKHFNHF